MKKIFFALFSMVAVLGMVACKTDDPFYSATENDDPRFLRPSSLESSQATSESVFRNENFEFEVLVIPVDYTKVEWIENGEVFAEGNTINRMFPTGSHEITILATTVAGKTTSRIINLTVKPLETDPTLDESEKARWFTIGAAKTIAGNHLVGVNAVYVGGVKAENFVNNGETLSFTVPSVAEGDQLVEVETAEGKFSCGFAKVTTEVWVDPGIEVVTLWQGSQVINWGDANVTIPAEDLADVPVGTVLKLAYNVPEAEYHAMRICGPWWDGDLVEQFDITEDTPNPFEFVYTEACKAIVDEQGGMLIVGFGYELTSVTYEKEVAGAEKTIWEGDVTINWGDSNVNLTPEDLSGVAVGAKVCLYYDVVEADYHAMRVTTPQWGDNPEDNLVAQFDITEETPKPYVFDYTDACKALVEDRGGMLIVGFGYKLTKVTVK